MSITCKEDLLNRQTEVKEQILYVQVQVVLHPVLRKFMMK